jgi:hypothetical protein
LKPDPQTADACEEIDEAERFRFRRGRALRHSLLEDADRELAGVGVAHS